VPGLALVAYGLYAVELSYGQLRAYAAPPCAGREPDPTGSCVVVAVGSIDCQRLQGDACSVLAPGQPVVIASWWGGPLRVSAASGESWWVKDEPREAWNRGLALALAGLALAAAGTLPLVHRR
jgi:hypothetical protein